MTAFDDTPSASQ